MWCLVKQGDNFTFLFYLLYFAIMLVDRYKLIRKLFSNKYLVEQCRSWPAEAATNGSKCILNL